MIMALLIDTARKKKKKRLIELLRRKNELQIKIDNLMSELGMLDSD